MSLLVFVSYLIGSLIFFFYGRYRSVFGLETRWLVYPILAIVVELPNMLVIYIIHYCTYKQVKENREEYRASSLMSDEESPRSKR